MFIGNCILGPLYDKDMTMNCSRQGCRWSLTVLLSYTDFKIPRSIKLLLNGLGV